MAIWSYYSCHSLAIATKGASEADMYVAANDYIIRSRRASRGIPSTHFLHHLAAKSTLHEMAITRSNTMKAGALDSLKQQTKYSLKERLDLL